MNNENKRQEKQETSTKINPSRKKDRISFISDEGEIQKEFQESPTAKSKVKKRGRRTKEEIREEVRKEILSESYDVNLGEVMLDTYTLGLGLIVHGIAKKKLLIKDDKKDALKNSLDLVSKQYLIPMMGKHAPLYMLGIISLTIISDTITEGENIEEVIEVEEETNAE